MLSGIGLAMAAEGSSATGWRCPAQGLHTACGSTSKHYARPLGVARWAAAVSEMSMLAAMDNAMNQESLEVESGWSSRQ